MEIVLFNGQHFAFDDNDLIAVSYHAPSQRCEYVLRGYASGSATVIVGAESADVYKQLRRLLNDRQAKRRTLAAYADVLEN